MFKLFSRGMMKASRFLFFIGAASLCVAAHADETISESVTLTEDTDWRSKGMVTIGRGVTVNLNGYKLTVAGLVGADEGTDLTRPDGIISTPSATWGDGFEGGTAHRLFDNRFTRADGRFAVSKVDGQFIMTVDYDFGEGNEQAVDMYKVYSEPTSSLWDRCPKSWNFYGSDIGW